MTVKVVMTTYAPEGPGQVRAEYASKSLASLLECLTCPEGLELHVADDGSPDPSFTDKLRTRANIIWKTDATYTNARRGGIGRSLNLALEMLPDDDLWMYTTDDWVLTQEMDLGVACDLIRQLGYDLVRLGPTHPRLQCKTMFQEGFGWWLDVDATCGGFAFATRPFLASKGLVRKIGPFDEGLDSYETEKLYAERVCSSGSISIACLHLDGPWTHIGDYEVGKFAPR